MRSCPAGSAIHVLSLIRMYSNTATQALILTLLDDSLASLANKLHPSVVEVGNVADFCVFCRRGKREHPLVAVVEVRKQCNGT